MAVGIVKKRDFLFYNFKNKGVCVQSYCLQKERFNAVIQEILELCSNTVTLLEVIKMKPQQIHWYRKPYVEVK